VAESHSGASGRKRSAIQRRKRDSAVADVFISYANQDRESAHRLANALIAVGWSVWWDRKIIAGQSFDQVIERELETAKSVVVLWSEHSIASEWVKNEAAVASQRGVLVPASVKSVKLPLEFRRKQTAELVGWNGDPSYSGFQALCEGISATLGSGPPPSSMSRQRRKSFWNRRLAWVALVCVVAGLGYGIYRSRERPPAAVSSPIASVTGTPTPQPPAGDHDPRLVGSWKANLVEGGVAFEIIMHFWPDGTLDYVITTPTGQQKVNRTWTYSNGILFERSLDPKEFPSSGSLRWIDENNFVLTIKDNGGDESQKGVERHYTRL
jgi:hypothetical protein